MRFSGSVCAFIDLESSSVSAYVCVVCTLCTFSVLPFRMPKDCLNMSCLLAVRCHVVTHA